MHLTECDKCEKRLEIYSKHEIRVEIIWTISERKEFQLCEDCARRVEQWIKEKDAKLCPK